MEYKILEKLMRAQWGNPRCHMNIKNNDSNFWGELKTVSLHTAIRQAKIVEAPYEQDERGGLSEEEWAVETILEDLC